MDLKVGVGLAGAAVAYAVTNVAEVKKGVRATRERLAYVWRRPRLMIEPVLNTLMVAMTSLMVWRGIVLATGLANPIVVIISGSMEPALYRGDILVLQNPAAYNPADISVFHVHGRGIPIVHRVVSKRDARRGQDSRERERMLFERKARLQALPWWRRPFNGDLDYYREDAPKSILLTKGDNNAVDDTGLYDNEPHAHDFQFSGKGTVYVPRAGMATIWLHEYPFAKFLLFLTMIAYAFTAYE